MSPRAGKPVPAVNNAIAVLEHLKSASNAPRTLSEIARATSINLSTCFNLLKTLEASRVLAYDPSMKTYRLGPLLGELGQLVDDDPSVLRLVVAEARSVREATGLGCFVMTFTENEAFVVLDKVESRDPIRVTIDVGASFPAGGAVAAKAWFAFIERSRAAEILVRHGLPGITSSSIVDMEAFAEVLDRTREQGYAESVGEYYPDHNAVAAPVFGRDGTPRFLLVVVGTTSQLPPAKLAFAGREVRAGAGRSTSRIGGTPPPRAPSKES